ncbi:hypothetical protein GCM10027277_03240 [Pseudoduganella ginsengisoli]|uniref:DUF4136 domain-containing protein n=2 Tax=Pseudoduganella ginsengisoli TaxID=1462440 RepID=A0A6L6Q5K6_9BURK|nr:hypothetical protein [Pseudoduganella ginsengisoli]
MAGVLAVMAAGALVAGCANRYAPAPSAVDFPASTQPKLQAAAHWGAIAGTIEQRLTEDLRKAPQRPYYISEPPPEASQFQRALTEHITSALVKSGYVVSRVPAGSLKVDIDVQALTFSEKRMQKMPGAVPTAIAVGVWMLAATADPILSTAGGVAAHEGYNYYYGQFGTGPVPKTELIVTVSVSDQYRYYARNSSAYYVADSDRTLYGLPEENDKAFKTYTIRGDK